MRLLFVIGNMYPNGDANFSITQTIADEIREEGHIVDILGKSDINYPPHSTDNAYHYFVNEINELNEIMSVRSKWSGISSIILHKRQRDVWMKMRKDGLYVENEYVVCCIKHIEMLHRKNNYDAVIAVSMPIWTSIALARADIGAKKVMYRLDPYAFNCLEKVRSFDEKIAIEEDILKKVDVAFLPITDYKDINNYEQLKVFSQKIYAVEFPNLIKRSVRSTSLSEEIRHEKLTFVYLGYLYEDIRNPKSVLDFFVRLREDLDFRLYFIGGGCDHLLDVYKEKLSNRLNVIKHVDLGEAYSIMQAANYLVNIGNTVLNMVPSKLFDYIATGKSIINFVKSEQCPTVEYIKKYKNGITVVDSEWKKFYNVLKSFIMQVHEDISFSEVQRIFEHNTPAYVAESFLSKINNITHNISNE